MQLFAVLIVGAALASIVPFTGGAQGSAREVQSLAAELDAEQFETFGAAAWPAARRGVAGTIPRSAMVLPPAFSSSGTLAAWSDGTYLYVWGTSEVPPDLAPDQVFAGVADAAVQVGRTDLSVIRFRDGSSAPRPGPVPAGMLVARMPL